MGKDEWIAIESEEPAIYEDIGLNQPAPYVLAVDAEGRMSVGYVRARYSRNHGLWWVFAKPIGAVTHWMPLPDPPEDKQ